MKKGSFVKYSIVILCFMGVILFTSLLTAPKIRLNNGDIVINLNEEFIDPGYKATTLWFDISDGVSIIGEVDTSKIGNYEITYIFKHTKKIRKVTVIETISPVITLEGDIDSYVCPNTEYIEEGYTALDNYDGDISDSVVKDIRKDKIIYTAVDSSGNIDTKERNLIYEDHKAPELKLNGDSNLTMIVGETFTDPGYVAIDNCLGDISNSVEVSGSVDTNTPGNYEIIYKVSDGANETTIKRSIRVINGIATLGSENAGGVIYLTFDDGPSSTYTRIILDTLKKYNVKATFFIVPKSGLEYLVKEAYDSGHSIGIHSITHTYSTVYASDEAFKNDVISTNNIIKNIIGKYTYLYRFPGGSSNTASMYYSSGIITRMASWLHENGYHYFDWNVSSGDAAGGSPSSDQIANNVISRLSKDRYNVVLMHDTHDYSAYAVEKIILYGIENGYTFAPITMNTKESHHSIAN